MGKLHATRPLERDSVSASLAFQADAARQRRANCVLIRGPRGIGKTTVLDQVATREAGRGGTVLRVAGQDGHHPLTALARLLDVTPGEHADPYPLFRQLHRAITELAAGQLVCLLIDDLPADDLLTPRWLHFALRRGEHLRLFVLITSPQNPHTPIGDPLIELAAHPRCEVIDLAPLSREAVATLVTSSLGERPEPDVIDLCHRLSAGNPGLVTSVLAGLRKPEQGSPGLPVVDPDTVSSTVIAKLGALPDHVRTVATALAVVGRADLELISPLVKLSPAAVTDALTLLAREYLLWEDQPAQLRERTSAAILAAIPPAELTDLRRKTAIILQNDGRPVDEVARRLLEVDRLDQPWMSRVLSDAAALAAGRGATDEVATYLARATEGDPRNVALRLDRALERARTDPVTTLAELSEVAEHLTDPVSRARLAVVFALTARTCGQPERGAEMLLRAAKDVSAAPPGLGTQSLRSQVIATQLAVALARPATVSSAIELAGGIPWPDGHNTGELSLLGMLAETTMRAGGPIAHAVHHAELAVSGVVGADDWSVPAAATVLRAAGKFDESRQVLDHAVAHFALVEDQLGHCRLRTHRARIQLATGALHDAEQEVQAAYDLASRKAWLAHEPEIGITLALAKAQLGKAGEATRLLLAVERAGIIDRPDIHPDFLYAKAWSHLARFEWQAAVDDLWECGRALDAAQLANPVLIPWWADAAVASGRLLGDRRRAAAALERGKDLVRRWPTPEGAALVTMVEGVVAPGKRGMDLSVEAAERFAGLPTQIWHALAQFIAGTELAQLGHEKAARSWLRDAIRQALACGHPQWIAVAHRVLQDAGGRMRVSAPCDYDILTSSERRIVELAIAGATNREIAGALYVSLRTVEVHLTRAYRKLGVTGRAGLSQVATVGGPRG